MSGRGARLLLSGYYGFGNFGDEAILRVFVDEWRSRRPEDSIAVLSGDPEHTAAAYGVTAVPRLNRREIVDAIRDADVVVSGGGGLLQNATSLRSLLYYTGIIREATRAGRTTAIFAQGIGPLDFFGKQVVKRACAAVDLAIVRDDASAALLRPLLPNVNVEVAADPVFLAPVEVTAAAAARIDREGIARVPSNLVAVIIRKSPMFDRFAGELAAGIDHLADAMGAQVVFLPLQRPGDSEAAIEVIRRCKTAPTLLGGGYDFGELTALFARCSAIVSMRLHALILAARLAVPFLAIPYDPKVSALVAALSYGLPPLDRSANVLKLLERLWEERPLLSAHLAVATAPLVKAAAAGFDSLARLVEGADAEVLKQS